LTSLALLGLPPGTPTTDCRTRLKVTVISLLNSSQLDFNNAQPPNKWKRTRSCTHSTSRHRVRDSEALLRSAAAKRRSRSFPECLDKVEYLTSCTSTKALVAKQLVDTAFSSVEFLRGIRSSEISRCGWSSPTSLRGGFL